MKIYFAGSIRAGREDADLYFKIIELLNTKNKVLTEHIGCKDISSMGEQGMTDEEIYERDCAWIRECDKVVAEVTRVSLGVGYEIAYAEKYNKKIICLYREEQGKRLSAMLSGNKNLTIYTYKTFDDIVKLYNEEKI